MRKPGTGAARDKRPDVSRPKSARSTERSATVRRSEPTTRPTTAGLRRRIIQEVTRRRAKAAR